MFTSGNFGNIGFNDVSKYYLSIPFLYGIPYYGQNQRVIKCILINQIIK